MTAFDRDEAKETYKELPPEELAHIAYVDEGYLAEAKQLAVAELERRGLAGKKDVLIASAQREMATRKQLREDADSAALENSNRFREKAGTAMLTVMLWVGALIAPHDSFWDRPSFEWPIALLVLLWIGLLIFAIRDARRGDRSDLHRYLTVPAVLFAVSLGGRLLFS